LNNLEQSIKNGWYQFKGWLLTIYLELHGCKVGSNLRCVGFPSFRQVPNKNITIKNNVTIGRNVTIELLNNGHLLLDNYVNIADNVMLSTESAIEIGEWVAIAENTSIRGSFHQLKKDELFRKQPNITAPIIIKKDVGIGAGCVIMPGAKLNEGVFLGANSVVKNHQELEAYGIYAGAPAKLIKFRT
jgi:acetyltransferase-like isoleucine patch superfamily enzyme